MSYKKCAVTLAGTSLGGSKAAVIIGGTIGIGAAIARKMAELGCGKIVVFGRNAKRGQKVCDTLKDKAGGKVEAAFVQGDLMTVDGMRQAAQAIQKAVPEGIDYLFETQNGVPTGVVTETADGLSDAFAVQAVSRFVLTFYLAERAALKPGAVIVSVCNPGRSVDDLDVEDLSLKQRTHLSHMKLFFQQSFRDSTVIDSFWEELIVKYPQYNFYHLHPGLVKTEQFTLGPFPLLIRPVVWLGLCTIGSTPDDYANLPVYVALQPEGHGALGDGHYFGPDLKPVQPGKWASQADNRQKLWAKLVQLVGEP